MAHTPDTAPEHALARRTLLGGTGLALAGTLAGCTGGEPEQDAAEGSDAQTEQRPRLPEPEIITTADWGARTPAIHLHTLHERPSYLVIHHTSTANTTDGSRTAAVDLAQMVQRGHMEQSWGDTGQHFTVSRGGHVLEGRHGSRVALNDGHTFMLGVHALGFNAYALGIECEGLYMVNPPPQTLYEGLVHICAYICQQYALPPSRIIGHRDVVKTSCCGDAFYPKLPILREDVRRSLETGEYQVTPGFGPDNLVDDSEITVNNYRDYVRG
ncbi:peptidoglycan recognition family protein [Micrococcus sp.]|uniref:peptidoglycan recognition protein family protein n=1 Tax=Micrococcus sp. TaxID=1271 RepID=UPI002A9088B6|nr:peptidoglycan recognition family protein [Micrococcus sp.]MDY6056144.1 peptidoglycan recognition family protein [Micrococcus sp.]